MVVRRLRYVSHVDDGRNESTRALEDDICFGTLSLHERSIVEGTQNNLDAELLKLGRFLLTAYERSNGQPGIMQK